jgi:predicted transcriptional regulator
MNKLQLTEATGNAIRVAIEAQATAKQAVIEASEAVNVSDSRVNDACEIAFKASQAGITGEAIAKVAGVTAMTVSRYIAGGKLMMQTEGKVTGSKAVSDMGNGYLTVGVVKECENVSQYNKAVAEGKKAKAGKAGKADKREPIEIAQSHVEALGKAIKSGKVTLEQVTDLFADMVTDLMAEAEAEEMQEA